MFISIQQPEYFPWLGYFDKLLQVDKVVFLDNVQFKKRYFENRNKIRTYQGSAWIRTPVITKGRYEQAIMDVEIDNTRPWQKKIVSSLLLNYKKTQFWPEAGDELIEVIERPYVKLAEFNLAVISFMMRKLGIETDYCLASTLGTVARGSDLILEICNKMSADGYLSGKDGKNYMSLESFTKEGIEVIFQNFYHPVYKQIHGDFEPNMSIIDLYFNHGPDSVSIIKSLSAKNTSH